MKRHLITLALAASTLLVAFSALPPTRTYTIILTEPQLNELIHVIDQSHAEHAPLVQLQKAIYQQIQSQLDAEKAATDSLKARDSRHSKPQPQK